MPSTYTQNLSLEKPATGEQAGTWGITANNNFDSIDTAIDGNITINVPLPSGQPTQGNPIILDTQEGQTAANLPPGLHKVVNFVGTLSADGYVVIRPGDSQRIYMVSNQCTDAAGAGNQYSLIFQQSDAGGSPGQTFKLQMGHSAILCADGGGPTANVYSVLDNPQFNNVTVNGSINIAGGQAQLALALNTATPTSEVRQLRFTTNNQSRWSLASPAGAESGGNVASNLQLTAFDDSGNALSTALRFNRAAGTVTVGSPNDYGARLSVVSGANQTGLNVVCQAGQAAPVLLVQDSNSVNLAAIDSGGNIRLFGSVVVQRGGTLYSGVGAAAPVTYNLMGSDAAPHAFTFVGGVLVNVA